MRGILDGSVAVAIGRDEDGFGTFLHHPVELVHKRDSLGPTQVLEEVRAMHLFDALVLPRPRVDTQIVDEVGPTLGADVDTGESFLLAGAATQVELKHLRPLCHLITRQCRWSDRSDPP